MSAQDKIQSSSAAGVVPRLTALPLSQICHQGLVGECSKQGCPYVHEITLIEEVEKEAAQRAVIESKIPNFLTSDARKTFSRGPVQVFFDRAGDKSRQGPRHDNDHVLTGAVRILPTTDEILSQRPPHLPAKAGGLGEGVHNFAASLFRHLRYDAGEGIVDVAYAAAQQMVAHHTTLAVSEGRFRHGTAGGKPYCLLLDVRPESATFTENAGAGFELSFRCPRELAGSGLVEQGVCERGMLVSLVHHNRETNAVGNVFLRTEHRLLSGDRGDQSRAGVVVSLADPGDIAKARELFRACKVQPHKMDFALVDYTGVLSAGFTHHLKRLQQLASPADPAGLSRSSPLASALLAPSEVQGRQMKPPRYSQAKGFAWRIGSLLETSPAAGSEPTLQTGDREAAVRHLQSVTTLDRGQAEALFDNLGREIAFTQGPPGTGKTYLGLSTIGVLLDSIDKKGRSPIIVVTQTNHSLDDTLEGLIKKGITNVARCGSNSQSSLLTRNHLLKVLSRKRKLSMAEATRKRPADKNKLRKLEAGENLAAAWTNDTSWVDRVSNLSLDDPERGSLDEKITSWSRFDDSPSSPTATFKHDSSDARRKPSKVASAKQQQRAKMRSWFNSLGIEEQCDAFIEAHRRYQVALAASLQARDFIDANTLKQMDVVGMTSTAAAQLHTLLLQVQPRILIIEEASELNEAHTLCAMLPSVEHVIAIGDPRQLRPHISEPILGTNQSSVFRFDESLFERLVHSNFPFAKLSIQRRAHPRLARLIKATDYPFVESHESTNSQEGPRGMLGRMQWMDHRYSESTSASGSGSDFGKSYTNDFEAHYIIQFVLKLVIHEHYWMTDITILTPYNGQLELITKLLTERSINTVLKEQDKKKILASSAIGDRFFANEGDIDEKIRSKEAISLPLKYVVRAATIDNYQGEEAPIVIFSPTRSNNRGSIGFLGIENRINVAVSRARNGFYVVGNAQLLRSKSRFWANVIGVFERHGVLDRGLRIICGKHPKSYGLVTSAHEGSFKKTADGKTPGCRECVAGKDKHQK